MKTHTHILAAAATGALAITMIMPANAQPLACAPRENIVQKLDEAYEEKRQSTALTSNGSALEVFVSMRGTWSILVSDPDGKACVVAVGEAWEPRQMIASADTDRTGRKLASSGRADD